jgi:AcrR family transcriptional regulator
MNLRQRRKIETTKLIRDAAIALSREIGTENVTIEAICKAAGISQRTFFNYFPFKEAVFVFTPPPLPLDAVLRFAAGTGDLLGDLTDLMVAQAIALESALAADAPSRQTAEKHPRLMPLQMEEMRKLETELQELIAARLSGKGKQVASAALAGAVLGATRTAVNRWQNAENAKLAQVVRETLEIFVKTVRTT